MAAGSKLLSGLFGFAVAARNYGYDAGWLSQKAVDIPVICVGNVAVGGTGKTPFVRWIVQSLLDSRAKPGILLRGYKGSYSGVRRVESSDSVGLVGDEALLHLNWFERRVPVVVSRRRIDGARLLQGIGVTHVVMDDGFQHRALKRDLNLLLLDISSEEKIEEWQCGTLLPAGRLREPLAVALQRTDAVVFVNKSGGQVVRTDELLTRFSGQKFIYNLKLQPLKGVVAGDRVVAVCAIGSPEPFFRSLREAGLNLVQQFSFPDHYSFAEKDVKELGSFGCPVLCTEKDAVKLSQFSSLKSKLIVASQEGGFDSEEQRTDFQRLIEEKCRKANKR